MRPSGTRPAVDWAALRAAAAEAMPHAYAPYSRFPVGVAGLVDDGRRGHRLQRRERLLRAGPVRRVRDGQRPRAHRRRPAGRRRLRGRGRAAADAVRALPAAAVGARRRRHAASRRCRSASCRCARCCPTRSAPTTCVAAAGSGEAEFDAIDVIRAKRDGGELSAEQIRWVIDAYTARRGARRADERAAHGGVLPRDVAGRAGRLDPGDDRLRRAQGPLLAGPADRRQALDRRRRRQDHAAAGAAGRRLRGRGAAAVRPRARATPAARWTSWRRSRAGGPTCTRRPTCGSCARSAR